MARRQEVDRTKFVCPFTYPSQAVKGLLEHPPAAALTYTPPGR